MFQAWGLWHPRLNVVRLSYIKEGRRGRQTQKNPHVLCEELAGGTGHEMTAEIWLGQEGMCALGAEVASYASS